MVKKNGSSGKRKLRDKESDSTPNTSIQDDEKLDKSFKTDAQISKKTNRQTRASSQKSKGKKSKENKPKKPNKNKKEEVTHTVSDTSSDSSDDEAHSPNSKFYRTPKSTDVEISSPSGTEDLEDPEIQAPQSHQKIIHDLSPPPPPEVREDTEFETSSGEDESSDEEDTGALHPGTYIGIISKHVLTVQKKTTDEKTKKALLPIVRQLTKLSIAIRKNEDDHSRKLDHMIEMMKNLTNTMETHAATTPSIKDFTESIQAATLPILEKQDTHTQALKTETKTRDKTLKEVQKVLTLITDKALNPEKIQESIHSATHDVVNLAIRAQDVHLKHIEATIQDTNAQVQHMLVTTDETSKQILSASTKITETLKTTDQQPKEPIHNRKEDDPPSNHTNAKRSKKTGVQDNLHLRTIVAKSCTEYRLTGHEIKRMIERQNIATTTKVHEFNTFRFQAEILCGSPQQMETLKTQLQRHKVLQKSLTFVTKQLKMQKMILLNTPEALDREQIIESIDESYFINKTDVSILAEQRSRIEGTKSWIILMTVALARTILEDGGLYLGPKKCPLRPHTWVPRCRKCQAIGHTEAKCQNKVHCEHCGAEGHEQAVCTAPVYCMNCNTNNLKHDTTFNAKHKASDPQCSTYRAVYADERRINDEKFKLKPKDIHFQKPQPQQTQKAQPRPHPSRDHQQRAQQLQQNHAPFEGNRFYHEDPFWPPFQHQGDSNCGPYDYVRPGKRNPY